MKKLIAVFCLFTGLFSSLAFADGQSVLQSRLAKIDSFYARFTQTITSVDNVLIQEGKGELWAKRPNLFQWNMISPDENSLVSDGETVWVYTPEIEQVTALNLKDASENDALLLLIMSNDSHNWQKYNVTQKGDNFILVPKVRDNNFQQFELNVTPNGFLSSFSIIEQDGQRSTYIFSHQQKGKIDMAKFRFIIPNGVTLDDQRQ